MSSRSNPHYLKPPFTPHQAYARRAAIEAIVSALDHSGGNVARAATALGLQRMHLHRLIHELGIQRPSPELSTLLSGIKSRGIMTHTELATILSLATHKPISEKPRLRYPVLYESASSYRTQLMEGVKQAVIDALAASGGNRAEAARRLGIGRIYLRELIIRFRIAPRLPPGRPYRR